MKNTFIDILEPFLKSITPLQVQPTPATSFVKKDPSIKAVIFDIYGTLIISASGDIMQSSYDSTMFRDALKESGYRINVKEQELMRIHKIFETEVNNGKEKAKKNGTPFPELNIVEIWTNTLAKSEQEGLITSDKDSDIRLFTFIFELKSNQVWPMPLLKDTLKKIKEKGYPMGIVSNAQFYTPIMMNYFLHGITKEDEFIDWFEKDLSVFSYKMLKGKPDTLVYKELIEPLNNYGLRPSDVLFVGNDMLKDIYAAQQVGFKTCFFAGDMRAYRLRKDHPEASKSKPDYVVTELQQILDILQ